MTIKCPICGAEYSEGRVKFCKICLYSIGSDPYLTNLLSHPSEEDFKVYIDSIVEYMALWRVRNQEKIRIVSGLVEMVEVEGGTFLMGATLEQGENARSEEKPVHKVTLDSYFIGKFPVTLDAYEKITNEMPSEFLGLQRPVERVSWYDAVEFCNKLSEMEGLQRAYHGKGKRIVCDFNSNGYRLPTEAEWEYAARGGKNSKGTKFSGSNNITDVGWHHTNETQDVGKKGANELGIYDMSGNVWEWCWDWYGEYSSESQTNPRGPSFGYTRVSRGGSWFLIGECGVAGRMHDIPETRYSFIGFRLARTKN